MPKDEFEPDDPMELVGVVLPAEENSMEIMAECVVEEYIKEGWDDENLMKLFRDPFYRATHAIYQQKGEDYVRFLIKGLREKWGYYKTEDKGRLIKMDLLKKKFIAFQRGR